MSIIQRLGEAGIAVVLLYLAVFLLIGAYAGKKIKNARDFNSAGQQLSWKLVAGSTIATTMGANVVIGKYDLIFESGLSGLTASLFWWVGWIFLIVIARRLRQSGATSIPSFLSIRYNEQTKKICSYCVLLTTTASSAASFLAIGTIFEALGICGRVAGTWIGALIILCFTIFGGLWGVAITDAIQSVILLVGFGVIFPYAVFHTAGGWDVVAAANTPERLNFFSGISPLSMLGWAISYTLSAGADPTFAQRIFSARSTRDALAGQGVAWTASLAVAGFAAALPGLAISVIFPDLTVGSEFTPLFLVTYLPSILSGLLMAALFGLILTSGDSYLLLLSSTLVDDIIRPRRPALSERRALAYSRLICVLSTGVICALALYVNKIYQLLKTGGGAYGAGVFLPLFLGCFWKKLSPKAANPAMIVGCVTSFCFDMFLKVPLGLELDGCILGALLCLVICLAGTWLERPCLQAK